MTQALLVKMNDDEPKINIASSNCIQSDSVTYPDIIKYCHVVYLCNSALDDEVDCSWQPMLDLEHGLISERCEPIFTEC
jgi:hypothetical protein